MFGIELYKLGLVLLGSIILTVIDTVADITWENNRWWKGVVRPSIYTVWGMLIVLIIYAIGVK